eukprot:GDKI01002332.1.p1 GENE.GDKI01002332.1~~GDKI01002332.1.p1  ORF type:complete len:240 (-),score=63.75 GDKI01002332.1:35-754(-)
MDPQKRANIVGEDEEDEAEYAQFKVVILGNGAVGKTSLAVRFTHDEFGKAYKQTIGLDFFVKRLVLPRDQQVCVQLWDIGGQSIGGKMISNYIHGAHAVVLCYDVTSLQSFNDLDDWLAIVKKTFTQEGGKMPYLALMCNKMDLVHMRQVKIDKHNAFVEENHCMSYFVSAKTGDQVAASFYKIAADLAGVTLTRPELEVQQKHVKAELINHPANDPQLPSNTGDVLKTPKKKGNCSIM